MIQVTLALIAHVPYPWRTFLYKQVENADKCLGITRVEGAWEEHQVYDLVVDDPFKSNPSYEEYSQNLM